MSLQWTAAVNEARRILLSPLRRAHYLITGSPEPAEEGGVTLPQEFLEWIFELQMERIEAPAATEEICTAALVDRFALLESQIHLEPRPDLGVLLAELTTLERFLGRET